MKIIYLIAKTFILFVDIATATVVAAAYRRESNIMNILKSSDF